MSGINPQGRDVASFKQPSAGRTRARLPLAHLHAPPAVLPYWHNQSSSYYEEVLVVRVHRVRNNEGLAQRSMRRQRHLKKKLQLHRRTRRTTSTCNVHAPSKSSCISPRRSSASASSRTHRRARQKLEVQPRRNARMQKQEAIYGGISDTARRPPTHATRPGTLSHQTRRPTRG